MSKKDILLCGPKIKQAYEAELDTNAFTDADKIKLDGVPNGGTAAPIDSPTFTGNPKAPTPSVGDDDTSIATTAFVNAEIDAKVLPNVRRLAIDGTFPDRTLSFDDVLVSMGMNKILDHKFGTNAAPVGATKISNATELAVKYQPLEFTNNAIVINQELQRYPTDFVTFPNSIKWNADEVELNTYIHSGAPVLTTTTPSANVNYSRTVTVQDASAAKIGTVIGLGQEAETNFHIMRSHSIFNAGAGDVYTLSFANKVSAANGGFDGTISIVSFTSAGADDAALANDIVTKINANSTLQAFKITAIKMPGVVGGFIVTWPRLPQTAVDDFGNTGKGSIAWLTRTWTSTGTGQRLEPQEVFGMNYVVSKSGNTLTLAHPVTVTTASVITFNPTRMMECAVTGGATTYTCQDASGLVVGQCGNYAYQDDNIRRITAIDTVSNPNSYTLEASVYMQAGHWITFYDLHKAISTTAVSGTNVLTFAATPAGVRVGMIYTNYFASPGMYHDNVNRVVSFDATTVTLDSPVIAGIGTTCVFTPFFVSGQFWSKYFLMPGVDNNTILAMELKAKFPHISKIAAWPAWWLFSNAQDPNPIAGGSGFSEIDMIDTFNYWNNGNANNITMNAPNGHTNIESKSYTTGGNVVLGNNLGDKERTIQMVWTRDRVYFYIDGTLVFARQGAWAQYLRANIGINLAHGSMRQGFNSNGFYPTDFSQYPYTYKIHGMKIWATPNATPI